MRLHSNSKGIVFILLCLIVATLQNVRVANYSTEILRTAKAAQINAYLDEQANPCNDFYGYACGKWERVQPAIEDIEMTTHMDQLKEIYERKCIQLLSDNYSGNSDYYQNVVDNKLRDFYKSCRNNEHHQRSFNSILRANDLSKKSLPANWPLTNFGFEEWKEPEYDWLLVVAEIQRLYGIDVLLGFDIRPDLKNPAMQRIVIGAPDLELGTKQYYSHFKYLIKRNDFKNRIKYHLLSHIKDCTRQWAAEVAQQVLDVETKLAQAIPDDFEAHTLQEHQIKEQPIAELQAAYGNYVDINRYLHQIFNKTLYLKVYETPSQYLANLVEVVRDTPKSVLANYTIWRLLDSFELDGDNEYLCTLEVIKYFPYQMEDLFYRYYGIMRTELRTIFADLKQTFRRKLENSEEFQWLTPKAKGQAIYRLNTMSLDVIANYEENSFFKRHIDELRLNKKAEYFYDNQLNILIWMHNISLQRYSEMVKISSDVETAKLPNDYEMQLLPMYNAVNNKVEIPIPFLQLSFFWNDAYPIAVKYSNIGFILAQQLMRGFLSTRDEAWDAETMSAYDLQAKCFEAQHNGIKYQNKIVSDGNSTTINIINSGALDLTYRLYQDMISPSGANENLPLLNLENNQLFFVQLAQMWCEDYNDSVEEFTILPAALRVNDAFRNFAEFSNVYKCKTGDYMNIETKCKML